MTSAEHLSDDGLLHFLVEKASDGDFLMGFKGFLWHRHAGDLARRWSLSEQQSAERYVRDLLENRLVISVARVGNKIQSVHIAEDPGSEAEDILPSGVSVELRFWNGTLWRS